MTREEYLISAYKKAYERVFKRLSTIEARGGWSGVERKMLAEIEKAVKELDKIAAANLPLIAETAFVQAGNQAVRIIAGATLGNPINKRLMGIVAENATNTLIEANHFFGRHTQDRIRQIALEIMGDKAAASVTVRDTQKRIVDELTREGLTGAIARDGSHIRIDNYAAMTARTTSREATNTSTIATCEEYDNDLVIVSTHYPTCDVCAPLQGRVYSISGKDKRFPYLYDLPGFKDGFKTFHPNCRHVLLPCVEKFWTPAEREKYLSDAKKPTTGDTRTHKEVAAYNKAQKIKRERWADRTQYERYRSVLGDDAPKSFSGFRAIKRADGEHWQYMELDYRRRNRLLNNPELSLPNAGMATAAKEKFTGYIFSAENPRGMAKGVAFSSRLGYNKDNWEALRKEILARAPEYPATPRSTGQHGIKYEQRIVLYGLKNTPANVVIGWQVLDGKTWMTTAIIKEVK